jgi:hypothetical protein
MATNTAPKSPPARHFAAPVVQYIRRDITFADNGTTVIVGTLPAGAIILSPLSGVYVTTAFNGNATNTLDIGYSTDTGVNNLATLLALGSIAFVVLDEVATAGTLIASETIISAVVVSTAAASAGVASIVIAFVEDNDR